MYPGNTTTSHHSRPEGGGGVGVGEKEVVEKMAGGYEKPSGCNRTLGYIREERACIFTYAYSTLAKAD